MGIGFERCAVLIEQWIRALEYERFDAGIGLGAYQVLCNLL